MRATSVVRDYRDSEAYRRSNRFRPSGKPVFPLAFSDRPVPVAAEPRRNIESLALAAVLVGFAVALVVRKGRA